MRREDYITTEGLFTLRNIIAMLFYRFCLKFLNIPSGVIKLIRNIYIYTYECCMLNERLHSNYNIKEDNVREIM